MKPTNDDIRRRLGLREVPKPPEDLARRIKADIPASFRYREQISAGGKGNGPAAASWGLSWQVAASFLALTVIGAGIYMATFESQKADTAATIAEADGRERVEFVPPTAPSAKPAARPLESDAKKQDLESRSNFAYEVSAPPPPPPAPRTQRADSAVDGSGQGGATGGVPGGVIGAVMAPAAIDAPEDGPGKLSEAQVAKARNEGYAEEKGALADADESAPAETEAAGLRASKDERVRDTAVAQSTAPKLASPTAVASLQTVGNDEPLRAGGKVQAPVVIKRVEIVYPERAKRALIQGVVIVEVVVDRNGDVKDVRVLKPLPMGLDEAAVTAIKQWKFKPGTLDGEPVKVIFNVSVNAKLER